MGFPDFLLTLQPVFDGRERRRVECAGAHSTNFVRRDPATLFQCSNMLHERRKRHVERLGEFADARWAPSESVDYGTACGIGQRLEDIVEMGCLLSHKAKYQPWIVSARAK